MGELEGTAGPASRLGLSRERILDAAVALLDRDGLGGFSMRRLAEELGVGTMTLYGYFRSRDALLDAVVDAGALQLELPVGDGDWRGRLRQLVLTMRRSLVEHPAVVELRLRRPLISAGALRITETAMELLRQAGFTAHEAAAIYRTLYVYTFGFAAFAPHGRADADARATRSALAALPADDYPALVEAAEAAAAVTADPALFEFGLDLLLDGVERALARPR